jgi:hypothetical protein
VNLLTKSKNDALILPQLAMMTKPPDRVDPAPVDMKDIDRQLEILRDALEGQLRVIARFSEDPTQVLMERELIENELQRLIAEFPLGQILENNEAQSFITLYSQDLNGWLILFKRLKGKMTQLEICQKMGINPPNFTKKKQSGRFTPVELKKIYDIITA